MPRFGPQLERLEAVAASKKLVAFGGKRDATAATTIHVRPPNVDGAVAGGAIALDGPVHALVFAAEDLLVAGSTRGGTGRISGWDTSRVPGEAPAAVFDVDSGSPVRALAVDAAGELVAAACADGSLQLYRLAITGGQPRLDRLARRALTDSPLTAVAFDPAGLVVAGSAGGALWAFPTSSFDTAAAKAIAAGGEGGVRAVVCLGDGRAAIGFGDGSIRLCYLVGAVDAADRSGDNGHAGAVRGLVLGPMLTDDAGREKSRRLFSVGEDGALKAWPLDSGRKPRTIELGAGAANAIALFAATTRDNAGTLLTTGVLYVGTHNRKLVGHALGPDGELVETGWPQSLDGALDRLAADLKDRRPSSGKARLAAITELEAIGEDEARILLDDALAGDPLPEVKVAAVEAIQRSNRRLSRPALRGVLGGVPAVRTAAFKAMLALDADAPLPAIRAGLAAGAEDVRLLALEALAPLAKTSAVAAAPIAEALSDQAGPVRLRAFELLRTLAPANDPLAPIRTALVRGPTDIRGLAIMTVGFRIGATDAAARAIVTAALDDASDEVGGRAFVVAAVQHPKLAAKLKEVEPGFAQAFTQATTAFGALHLPEPGPLTDDDLEPLFSALACKNPYSAIRGAGSLVALGDARALGAVLQLTRESDAKLRRIATAMLWNASRVFADDPRIGPRLVWLLDDADAEVRATAFTALEGGAGDDETLRLDLAELALRCSQEDIRVRALAILVKHQGPRADALLGDALDDEATKVRTEAYRTLWAWHANEPEVPLARGAASRHADIRQQVVTEIERRRAGKQSTKAMDALILKLVKDASPQVGLAAYKALTKEDEDQKKAEIHLAAMASPTVAVRAAGAAGSAKAPAGAVRAKLVELIKEDNPPVHLAAIEALDAVAPDDAEGFALAFASIFYELQVRAAELCGRRRDHRAIAPTQRLLSIPKTDVNRPSDGIRQRAARALADVGDPSTIPFLVDLLDDEDGTVREMGARGLATACGPGNDAPLVGALAHADLSVRSWAAEGLAKIGDTRALPVLAGTQRHEHRPIRIGAIVGFVALGPDGVRGLRQGLEDKDREIQDLAFAVIVARDIALAQIGVAPDLLLDTLSSPSPELRFAGARILEARVGGEGVVTEEIVGPRRPEKAADMKEWPPEARRPGLLEMLIEALASDDPARRYAAAQVLAVRNQPLTFWKEAARLAGPSRAAPVPRTNYTGERREARKAGWLRRMVVGKRVVDPNITEIERVSSVLTRIGTGRPVAARTGGIDPADVNRLVFGVYAGLIRQAPARGEADETHRVRRDAVGRLVDLAREASVGHEAVLPVLAHALRDPHHLVRQAAMTALRSLHPAGSLEPLAQALGSAADVGKAALDELLAAALAGPAGDAGNAARARTLVEGAIDADDKDVREHAALRLPRLYPSGSVEPHLRAAGSKHADIRMTAISSLLGIRDAGPEVADAIAGALTSELPDLRFAAAVGLAKRGDPRGVDVLATFLRSEDQVYEAREALTDLAVTPAGAAAAAAAIAARLDDDPDRTAERDDLIEDLGKIGDPIAIPTMLRILEEPPKEDDDEWMLERVRDNTFEAFEEISKDKKAQPRRLPDGREVEVYREDRALAYLAPLSRSAKPETRVHAAKKLGALEDAQAEELLGKLLLDRDETVRIAAGEALAQRVELFPSATLAPLEAALRGGRRELVLPAALGLAARGRPEAFQPLMLVLKAGEGDDVRERALLALGSLGDKRALEDIVALLSPEPDDEAGKLLSPAAAEALGRMLPKLGSSAASDAEPGPLDPDVLRDRVERLAISGVASMRERAIIGLRHAGDERSRAVIERVVRDHDATNHLRSLAVEQLGILGDLASEPVLSEALDDDDWDIREAGLKALKKLFPGDRTRVDLLALASKHDEISEPAAQRLAITGEPSHLVARFPAIESDEVRKQLRDGLIRRGAMPRAEVETALRGDDPRARADAAWMAGVAADRALGGALAVAVERSAEGWRAARTNAGTRDDERIEREVRAWYASLWAARRIGAATEAHATKALDPDAPAQVRGQGAAVLAASTSAQALTALGKALTDSEADIRELAARALATQEGAAQAAVRSLGSQLDAGSLAIVAPAVMPAVAGELFASDGTRSVATAASIASRSVAELVAIATASGKDPARLAAIMALGRVGGDEAKAALEGILENKKEDDAVRATAYRALKKLLRAEEAAARFKDGGDKDKKGPGGGGGGGGGGSRDEDSDDDDDDDDDDELSSDDDEGDDDEDSDDGGDDDDDDSDDDDDDDDSGGGGGGGGGSRAEKVARTGVKRDQNTMYFVRDGDVWGMPRRQPGKPAGKAQLIAKGAVQMDLTTYLYYVDADGDIARVQRQRGGAARSDDDDDDDGDEDDDE
jgi:ParB family chromosome partitioning protein